MKNIRKASTAILLRDTPLSETFEVLLLQRSKALSFARGCWVFPGGAIDSNDYPLGINSDSEDKKALLQAARCAAVRETQEECGINIAEQEFHYYSHWTTPEQESKRFATWFMLAKAPLEHDVQIDDSEIKDYQWISPANAITKMEAGELKMLPPTYVCLYELGQCRSISEAIDFSCKRDAPVYKPRFHKQEDEMLLLYQQDVAYESGDINSAGPQHRLRIKGRNFDYIKTL